MCGTLSLTGDVATTLPIELVTFDAQNTDGSKNHLTWTTASETNNKHFDIERSSDGNTFQSIGQVKGNNKPSSYEFFDNQPFTISYYRLKQTDFDGTSTLSKVITLSSNSIKSFNVYPTVVTNTITIQSPNTNLPTTIIDMTGKVLREFATTPSSIDVSDLGAGVYIVRVGNETTRVVKTN